MSNKNQDDNHNSDDWWYYDYSRMKRSMYESDPTLDPDYEKTLLIISQKSAAVVFIL